MNAVKALSQYLDRPLRLVQPSVWKRVFELRAGETVLMTMRFEKWYSTHPFIEGFGGTWLLSKPSFWRPTLDVTAKGSQLPFARFVTGKWGRGGTFELPNGERILYTADPWKMNGAHELFTPNTVRLASIRRESVWKSVLTVTIDRSSELLDRHPWVLMVVHHIVQERRSRAAAM